MIDRSDSKTLNNIVVHVIILNIVICFLAINDIYISHRFLMLSVYKINFSKFSGVSMLSSSRFLNFFLFWLINAPALCFSSLHFLHNSHLLSLPHFIHFIIYFGYMVNSHRRFSLYLSLVSYVINLVINQPFAFYQFYYKLFLYSHIEKD